MQPANAEQALFCDGVWVAKAAGDLERGAIDGLVLGAVGNERGDLGGLDQATQVDVFEDCGQGILVHALQKAGGGIARVTGQYPA